MQGPKLIHKDIRTLPGLNKEVAFFDTAKNAMTSYWTDGIHVYWS